MASPGELVECLSEALGIPAATVVVHDRNLVIAGLRSKGGRGWSAAKVSARDAANLITAILGSDHVKDSVSAVTQYGMTSPDRRRSSEMSFSATGVASLVGLAADHSFIDAIEALILAAIGDQQFAASPPLVDITASSPSTLGTIRVAGLKNGMTATVVYAAQGDHAERRSIAAADLSQYRRISYRTIQRVAQLLMKGE